MRVRGRLLGLVAVVALVASGCVWPQFRFDASHSGWNTVPQEKILSTAKVGSLTTKWAASTGSFVGSSPAVGIGVVYVGSQDGKVYALKATTGAVLWTDTTPDPLNGAVTSSPAVGNRVVYVGSDDGNVYAFGLS